MSINRNTFNLEGKTALVTGGSSGIGKAICERFAAHGAEVFNLDLEPSNDDSQPEGNNVIKTLQANVTSFSEIEQAVGSIPNDRIDILVNNAGVAHIGNIEQTSEADLDRIYQVNVKGVFNCTKAVIPYMKKLGGAILNLASIASVVGLADRFAYSMSKGAVLTMTYSVAKDYLSDGIRCNCLAPARIHTPFVDGFLAANYPGQEREMFDKLSKTQPIGRMGTPEEVAALALYLCSDEASFITGTCYPVDGGFITLNS